MKSQLIRECPGVQKTSFNDRVQRPDSVTRGAGFSTADWAVGLAARADASSVFFTGVVETGVVETGVVGLLFPAMQKPPAVAT